MGSVSKMANKMAPTPFISEKNVWNIGFMLFKSTGLDSRFQRMNRFWKTCTESWDISQNMSNFWWFCLVGRFWTLSFVKRCWPTAGKGSPFTVINCTFLHLLVLGGDTFGRNISSVRQDRYLVRYENVFDRIWLCIWKDMIEYQIRYNSVSGSNW